MAQKDFPTQIRPMTMFKPLPARAPMMVGNMTVVDAKGRPVVDEDKDETIRKLRSSLALLEAENAARDEAKRAAVRASVAKHREKKRAKPPT